MNYEQDIYTLHTYLEGSCNKIDYCWLYCGHYRFVTGFQLELFVGHKFNIIYKYLFNFVFIVCIHIYLIGNWLLVHHKFVFLSCSLINVIVMWFIWISHALLTIFGFNLHVCIYVPSGYSFFLYILGIFSN